ncbi:MAG: 2-oxoacid:ferredoxin oxidoreductase subunit beta [Chromatiales bacterium]|nr:2-oxoacid:ferredoxin oxidoreductase subunit beta [Chromatiales bacterium]
MSTVETAITLAPKQYKSDVKPVWCPGCGHFAVLNAMTKAFSALGLPPEQVAVVSGIGCSSRVPAYTSVYGFHGLHGRALAVGTGLKVARPDLTVVVAGGDGDGFSIGGNHFLHACRRNLDMTYVVMDNEVYGMTKGQASPTTAADWSASKLTPGGPGMRPFQPASIAVAAGATFVARCFSGQPNEIARVLVEAVRHPGFSFVQALSPCPTFCPEQKEWKHVVRPFDAEPTDDPAEASRRLQADDGMSTGIVLAARRPSWTPSSGGASASATTIEAIEAEIEA